MAKIEDLEELKKTFRIADNLRIKLMKKLANDSVKYLQQKRLVKELAGEIVEIEKQHLLKK